MRVPWFALTSLHDDTPSSDILLVKFASIQHRIQSLYEKASTWQEEIAILIPLDPNRITVHINTIETYPEKDFDKVVGLLHSDVVSTVSVSHSCHVHVLYLSIF
jgi:hypothetical protein